MASNHGQFNLDNDRYRRMANALRFLAMDAVQAAKSGHPGMPMGIADVASVLFGEFFKHNPNAPFWPDRDRFVLSAGHGSMLLYALLHLTGYKDIDMSQLRDFRKLGSRTAGHPELGSSGGIETTTGPLGQGIGNAVGMAIAERVLAQRFGKDLVNHYTYVIAGDGCLMEGISQEAASLASHLGLGKLIILFDDNKISIDGSTTLTVSEDQTTRFAALGWDTSDIDGHDVNAIATAISAARKDHRPSIIACRTIIGYGAPTKEGSSATHGAPLGEEEIAGARNRFDWHYLPFEIPEEISADWTAAGTRCKSIYDSWEDLYENKNVNTRESFTNAINGNLPIELSADIAIYKERLAKERPTLSTRVASGNALEIVNKIVPETIGGSADLTGSVNTKTSAHYGISKNSFDGRYIYYGVREHLMAAAMNGMAVHGGIIPYGGTFLVFSDYCRPAIRLSAMMKKRVIYVFTHDSIGLGEDGPTHQPIEHLAALRAIPNLKVFRPADAIETTECWELALASADAPSVLALSRQAVPAVRLEYSISNLSARGGYELIPAEGEPKITLFATGSETALAVEAHKVLERSGHPTRVVSIPCWELFEKQNEEYRNSVIGPSPVRVAIEAAAPMGWERFIGSEGAFIGMTGFGASGPATDLFKHFGITVEAIVDKAKKLLKKSDAV